MLEHFSHAQQVGGVLPPQFPEELDFDYEEALSRTDSMRLTFPTFFQDDELDLENTAACNIEYGLMDLAASKVNVDKKLARLINMNRPGFRGGWLV